MKFLSRTISVLMVLSLLLSIKMTAQAQNPKFMERNADGSYAVSEVLKTFKAYVDTEHNLPDTGDASIEYVRSFINEIPRNEDDYDPVIRYGNEDASELTGEDWEKLYQDCFAVIDQKREQLSQQSSDPKKSTAEQPGTDAPQSGSKNGFVWIIVTIIIIAIAVAVFLLVKAQKRKQPVRINKNNSTDTTTTNNDGNNGASDVIIRRKTTSIMYDQNIDDVINNSNYMALNASSFCADSAVKTMYFKNSCILDIYNMYADDLRNPNNPKEDGCMVLGRWIHDEGADEYSVSLEEVVFPGDDAVFAEYELDFGGKIKVKINEKLRKLRRETNLQYDLTCWVHSHPGLGVFFSNTDCNLHLLHKHPNHPKFLTAIVIDILTPQQELGVFTFKHDMSINSRADLTQLYSLEEWYKWAVESKRNAVFYEEHYNTLDSAKSRNNSCYNVMLSNSVIIDMGIIASDPNHKEIYFVHGFSSQQSEQTINTAVKIENTDTANDSELIGCFIAVTHRSYPTIKKTVANYLDKTRFVLVYSIADGMLTTIPIIANDLCADESYYAEQPLEDLKIWTRRKR